MDAVATAPVLYRVAALLQCGWRQRLLARQFPFPTRGFFQTLARAVLRQLSTSSNSALCRYPGAASNAAHKSILTLN